METHIVTIQLHCKRFQHCQQRAFPSSLYRTRASCGKVGLVVLLSTLGTSVQQRKHRVLLGRSTRRQPGPTLVPTCITTDTLQYCRTQREWRRFGRGGCLPGRCRSRREHRGSPPGTSHLAAGLARLGSRPKDREVRTFSYRRAIQRLQPKQLSRNHG